MTNAEIIQHVCKRPGMWMPGVELERVYAFLEGLHAGSGCLTGFREWLAPTVGNVASNIVWWGVVDALLDREACPPDERIARLGQLLDEFRQFVSAEPSHHGLMRVFVRYDAWLKARYS